MEPLVAALAIEDRVDLLVRAGDLEFFGTVPVPFDEAGQSEGLRLNAVRDSIKQLLVALLADETFGANASEFFNGLASFVVSVPGVVEDNRRLLQVALWQSKPNTHISYAGKPYLDFPDMLADIGGELIRSQNNAWAADQRERFQLSVFVVNDATASAAFEYVKRLMSRPAQSPTDFVYVKIHNGINVGVVQRSGGESVEVKTVHAESGHGYPRKTLADHKFKGVCPYHGDCFEGLVASHSFARRVATHPRKFPRWKKLQERLRKTNPALKGKAFDHELFHKILDSAEGVDLLSHYVAQLLWQLSIGEQAPKAIIIGGQMASPPVLKALRQKVLAWSGGYPRRRELTKSGIIGYISMSSAEGGELSTAEVRGALVLSMARSNQPTIRAGDAIRQIAITPISIPRRVKHLRIVKE